MKKIISFLRWEFKGCTRSPSFWGALIVILGLVMFLFDCFCEYHSDITMTTVHNILCHPFNFDNLIYISVFHSV